MPADGFGPLYHRKQKNTAEKGFSFLSAYDTLEKTECEKGESVSMTPNQALCAACRLYGFDPAGAQCVSNTTNLMYGAPKGSGYSFLRLSQRPRACFNQMLADFSHGYVEGVQKTRWLCTMVCPAPARRPA